MTSMTPELRRAIEEAGGIPPRIIDPVTNVDYVLIRADVYEIVRSLLEPDDGLEPKVMTAMIREAMKGNWDAPEMDDYDAFDEQTP